VSVARPLAKGEGLTVPVSRCQASNRCGKKRQQQEEYMPEHAGRDRPATERRRGEKALSSGLREARTLVLGPYGTA